jgi:hypothetical protein
MWTGLGPVGGHGTHVTEKVLSISNPAYVHFPFDRLIKAILITTLCTLFITSIRHGIYSQILRPFHFLFSCCQCNYIYINLI